jgi:co-chaperonin GroES (HSP10)
MTQTSKGILLPEETRDTELWNTQVARVIDLGPLAFKNRKDLTIWPEGEWVKRGDYVRFKKYGGDRWMVPVEGKEGSTNASDCAMFILVEDVNISGKVTSHPNRIRGFI